MEISTVAIRKEFIVVNMLCQGLRTAANAEIFIVGMPGTIEGSALSFGGV